MSKEDLEFKIFKLESARRRLFLQFIMIGLAAILFTSCLSYGAHQSLNWKLDAGVRIAMVCVLLVSFAKLTYEQFATHSLIEAAISECKQMLIEDENVCKSQ